MVALAVLGGIVLVPPVVASDETVVLGVGDSNIWEGPRIEDATVFWETCDVDGTVVGPCFDYAFEVEPGGRRLRVGLDYPDRTDAWAFALIEPGRGAPTWNPATDTDGREYGANLWEGRQTLEVYRDDPVAGTWRARVVPVRVTDSPFRVRAKLEGDADLLPPRDGALRPNLRGRPPFSFGFATSPVLVRPGRGNPVEQQPLVADGKPLSSCMPDEAIELAEHHSPEELLLQGPVRCLRMSSGIENTGDGPLEIEMTADGSTLEASQVVRGDPTPHRAGTGSFHATHGHYHYENVAEYRLYSMAPGRIHEVSRRRKQGFCTGPSGIVDFDRFVQDPWIDAASVCEREVVTSGKGYVRLARGWFDVYGWQLPGQYLDFTGQPDGEYVVVVEADPDGLLLETDERDNVAWARIRVRGWSVESVSSGYCPHPGQRMSESHIICSSIG